jgi:uncharacterized RDD family membrane protein YckC
VSRLIRNERARQLQGQRAGIVSRGLAFGADVGIAFLVYVVIVTVVNFLWDLFFSERVAIPTPPSWLSGLAIFAILVVYLLLGWGSTGRTIGTQLMGLRVVGAEGQTLRPRTAFLRALFCAAFYPGLAWALVDRRNRSLQDIVLKTVVVYDWIPEAARPRRVSPGPPASVGSGEARA